jgi:hypothetical protein
MPLDQIVERFGRNRIIGIKEVNVVNSYEPGDGASVLQRRRHGSLRGQGMARLVTVATYAIAPIGLFYVGFASIQV